MTSAVARMETRITLAADGNAAKAVADVDEGLKGMGEASGDLEKGLLGVRDLVGDLPAPVQKMADVFGGAEKILQAMPGPIGIVGAGLTVAAAGAFLLYKHVSETEAKVAALGNAGTERLAAVFGASVDEAIKLQQAVGDLPTRLQPSEQLLRAVAERAKAMGQDGTAAATKFAEAIAKGPEALREFEREFGRLAAAADDLPDVARRLGLSREAAGIAAQVGNEAERAKKAAQEALVAERVRVALESEAGRLTQQAASAALVRSLELTEQAASLRAQANVQAEVVAKARDEANALQAVVDRQREATAAATQRASIAGVIAAEIAAEEAKANTLMSERDALQRRLQLSQFKGAEIERLTVQLTTQRNAGLIDELTYRREIAGLQAQTAQLLAGEQALAKQAEASLDARRQKAQAARDAELASVARLARAQADAAEQSVLTAGQATALRLRELAALEQAEVAKAKRDANTERGRLAAVEAVRLEFAGKRRALDQAAVAEQRRVEDELTATLTAQAQRSAEIAARTVEAVTAGAARRASALAERLRAAGDDERADLVERQQAWVDYQATIERVNREIGAQIATTGAESEDRRNLERQELEAQAQAYEEYQARLNAADAAREARLRASVTSAVEAIRAPAAALVAGGGPGAKIGAATAALADGVAKVAANWKGLKGSAGDAISATGAVAAAFIDNERDKAFVLAATETAASVASFAAGDFVGGAGHAAAAALYGAVAGGALASGAGGASGGAGGVSAGGGAGAGGASGGASAPAEGGRVVNIYLTKGFVVGTPQQVGVAVQSAMRSLAGTGLRAAGG